MRYVSGREVNSITYLEMEGEEGRGIQGIWFEELVCYLLKQATKAEE